jgi:hypothetical protein
MATADEYAARIRQLLEERKRLAEALVRIDQTLDSIGTLLGTPPSPRPGLPVTAPPDGAVAAPRRRRGRGNYKITAEEFILDFVRQNKTPPTTREINAHWMSAGRGHTADNTLVRMVKARQLQRHRIEGERGSRYALP